MPGPNNNDIAGTYQTTYALKQGNFGERMAADWLAANGHQILYYKPDIQGTSVRGPDIVTLKDGKVYVVDNKAYATGRDVGSVSSLTTNWTDNIDATKALFQSMAGDPARTPAERDLYSQAVGLIDQGSVEKVVTNAALAADGNHSSDMATRLKDDGVTFIDVTGPDGAETATPSTQAADPVQAPDATSGQAADPAEARSRVDDGTGILPPGGTGPRDGTVTEGEPGADMAFVGAVTVGVAAAGGAVVLAGGEALAAAGVGAAGVGTLAVGAGEVAVGAGEVAVGAGEAAVGAGEAAAGAGEAAAGAGEAAAGAGEATAGAGEATAGAGEAAGAGESAGEGAAGGPRVDVRFRVETGPEPGVRVAEPAADLQRAAEEYATEQQAAAGAQQASALQPLEAVPLFAAGSGQATGDGQSDDGNAASSASAPASVAGPTGSTVYRDTGGVAHAANLDTPNGPAYVDDQGLVHQANESAASPPADGQPPAGLDGAQQVQSSSSAGVDAGQQTQSSSSAGVDAGQQTQSSSSAGVIAGDAEGATANGGAPAYGNGSNAADRSADVNTLSAIALGDDVGQSAGVSALVVPGASIAFLVPEPAIDSGRRQPELPSRDGDAANTIPEQSWSSPEPESGAGGAQPITVEPWEGQRGIEPIPLAPLEGVPTDAPDPWSPDGPDAPDGGIDPWPPEQPHAPEGGIDPGIELPPLPDDIDPGFELPPLPDDIDPGFELPPLPDDIDPGIELPPLPDEVVPQPGDVLLLRNDLARDQLPLAGDNGAVGAGSVFDPLMTGFDAAAVASTWHLDDGSDAAAITSTAHIDNVSAAGLGSAAPLAGEIRDKPHVDDGSAAALASTSHVDDGSDSAALAGTGHIDDGSDAAGLAASG